MACHGPDHRPAQFVAHSGLGLARVGKPISPPHRTRVCGHARLDVAAAPLQEDRGGPRVACSHPIARIPWVVGANQIQHGAIGRGRMTGVTQDDGANLALGVQNPQHRNIRINRPAAPWRIAGAPVEPHGAEADGVIQQLRLEVRNGGREEPLRALCEEGIVF